MWLTRAGDGGTSGREVYLYRLEAGSFVPTERFVTVKEARIVLNE